MSGLQVAFGIPERALDIAFTAAPGTTVALIGENGAGKSSTFDVVSGLLRPAEAHVRLGDRVLVRTGATGRRVWVPSHARGVVQLVQRPLLFPTMSVGENVAFGLRAAGRPRAKAAAAAQHMLERVGAGQLGERRPHELSGGQAQRVAIARALVTDPDLLLLDEPLAALDRASTAAIMGLLSELLVDRTVLLITHDPAEARTLADQVVVLDGGRAAQTGTWDDIATAPACDFAAGFTA